MGYDLTFTQRIKTTKTAEGKEGWKKLKHREVSNLEHKVGG